MIVEEPRPRLFTREQFYVMKEMGWFGETRVELIEGEIVEMSPPLHSHVFVVNALNRVFARNVSNDFVVSIQNPVHLGANTNPQPDVAILKGDLREFKLEMPSHAALAIEVSDSTLRYDRTKKASIYAKAGILDYWIVNMEDRIVEVYREPVSAVGFFFGFNYASKTIYRPGDTITPMNLPEMRVDVSDILP